MCVGWGGGREGGGVELAVIARVVGEGSAYPLTHWSVGRRGEGEWGEQGQRGRGVRVAAKLFFFVISCFA